MEFASIIPQLCGALSEDFVRLRWVLRFRWIRVFQLILRRYRLMRCLERCLLSCVFFADFWFQRIIDWISCFSLTAWLCCFVNWLLLVRLFLSLRLVVWVVVHWGFLGRFLWMSDRILFRRVWTGLVRVVLVVRQGDLCSEVFCHLFVQLLGDFCSLLLEWIWGLIRSLRDV